MAFERTQAAGRKWGPFVLAVAVAVGISLGLPPAVDWVENRDSDAKPFETPIPPVEFLYLDGDRILKFLSALEGGEVGPINRISKEISSVKGGVSQGGLEFGASSQHETSAESTLTQNESSALSLLLASLKSNERKGVAYETVDLDAPADLDELWEGKLVRFVTHHLLSPGYLRPYVVVRQSATLAALFPRSAGSEADLAKFRDQRRKAKSFMRQVGPDPRLTFAVEPPPQNGGEGIKVLLPMSYSGLTQERSLLEKGRDEYTGGRLVVIGKVIRLFEEETEAHCGAKRACPNATIPEYTDWATREIWTNPLEQASNYLIDHVSRSCEMPHVAGRRCFISKLQNQTELYSPGAVILPLAIYK